MFGTNIESNKNKHTCSVTKIMGVIIEKDFIGHWGSPTATIDWCEANYEVSNYIAEFWNTVSNVVMVGLPLFGFVQGIKDRLEPRFIWSYISIFFVGVGSWLFHGTLLYESQLLDELPMIWGSAFLVYSLREVSSSPGKQNNKFMIFLCLYCTVVTIVYLTIKKPVFHEAAYALMVFSMVYYSVIILKNHKHSFKLFVSSSCLYGFGFLIWNIDNVFCDTIRAVRKDVGYPFKPFLQGHAWWHIFAGIGTHLSILFSVHARSKYLRRKTEIQSPFGILPLVVRVSDKK